MKKRIFGTLLMGALVVSSVSTFTSCKDYDDDIKTNETAIAAVKADLTAAQTDLTQKLDQAKSELNTAIATKASAETVTALAGKVSGLETLLNDTKAALQGDIAAMETTLATLTGKVDGLAGLSTEVAGLATDVSGLNAKVGELEAGRTAAEANLQQQMAALQNLETRLNELAQQQVPVQVDYSEQIAALQTQLANIQASIMSSDEVNAMRQQMTEASAAVSTFSSSINVLTVFVQRMLASLNLSPSQFYGGIEGVDIFAFSPWIEENEHDNIGTKWHYFDRTSRTASISQEGVADYHISPTTVDLTGATISFFTREADIKKPATDEQTRTAPVSNNNNVYPVYESIDSLLKYRSNSLSNQGLLNVPFKVDNIRNIASKLYNQSIGTITAVQIKQKDANGKDTTVTSDYALVVPEIAEQLLVCDNSFRATATEHLDSIGKKNQGTVNSLHLHRSFGYLALSDTKPTHTVNYTDSFDITKVLETHYINPDTAIIDTLSDHTHGHHSSPFHQRRDGDATMLITKCNKLTAAQLEALGLHYEINLVDYYLGTTGTSESAHMELVTKKVGGVDHIFAFPRNVKEDGTTDFGRPANRSAKGRMPIVCIELKNEGGETVSFAWMKFLISEGPEEPVVENNIERSFTLETDYYADCQGAEGQVTWNQIEYNLYNYLNMSKLLFDETYVFDFCAETQIQVEGDVTKVKEERIGYQFKRNSNGSFTKVTTRPDSLGVVTEEWNESAQGVEDATTHIIKWKLSNDDLWAIYRDLNNRGKLDRSGNDITNTEAVSTWVRYKRKNTTDGNPAVYVQITIPAGKLHFAKGQFSDTKTLTYWYNLNSKVNAQNASVAKEVRVSVPVPVPNTPATAPTILGGNNCVDLPTIAEMLTINNDNLLERTEFLKDLHDFFRNGQLSGAVKNAANFPLLNRSIVTPEFEFTVPSTTVGNATFNATNGEWKVKGISGSEFTLKLANNNKEIRIIKKGSTPITPNQILVCINDDADGIQSVIKYHQGQNQDDILNYRGHNDLGELETFTAYIMINTPDACAPIEFDDMWFNVRFLRPLDLMDPNGFRREDARNDWQYVDLAQVAIVKDWRDYLGDPNNANQGRDQNNKFDFDYYQVELDADETNFRTDAGFGTDIRVAISGTNGDNLTDVFNLNTTTDANYAINNLWKTSEVQGLMVEKVIDRNGTPCPANVKSTLIRYKNNSGVTGGFRMFLPIRMTYVFGQFVQNAQAKYVTIEINKSQNQDQQ